MKLVIPNSKSRRNSSRIPRHDFWLTIGVCRPRGRYGVSRTHWIAKIEGTRGKGRWHWFRGRAVREVAWEYMLQRFAQLNLVGLEEITSSLWFAYYRFRRTR